MSKRISLEIENEKIAFADLTNGETLEIVAVCESGNIFLIDLESREKVFLATLPFNSIPNLLDDFNPLEVLENLSQTELIQLLENQSLNVDSIESIAKKNKSFVKNLSLNAKLYSYSNYICIVQNKGTSGVVLDLSKPDFQKRLERGDYHVGYCTFPIAFYEKDNQTFLIHGTDWNRLDITCLETDELITKRVIDYDTDSNYFDYFHSSLLVSPDAKHFTTNGWHWHPFGQIYCFSIDNFLQKFELSYQAVDVCDEDFYDLDWDRPLCWIDEKTLAIGFNQQICDENQGKFPSEILFFDIIQNKIRRRIKFDGFSLGLEGEVRGKLFYDDEKQQIIGLNDRSGVLIADLNGRKIAQYSDLTSYSYSPKHKLFYQLSDKNRQLEFVRLEDI